MKPIWAVRMDRSESKAAETLRAHPLVRVCEIGDSLWLSGHVLDDALDLALRKLPATAHFSVLPDGQLRHAGCRVPKGKLPAGEWTGICDWITLDAKPAALAGQLGDRTPLRLARSTEEKTPTVLVTEWDRFRAFALTKPEIRVRPLAFAVSVDGRALVRGSPLPPLPGRRYLEQDRLALPCGFVLWPPVDAAVLYELLELGAGDLAVFKPDGSFERIAASRFVRATRSAVRLTGEAFER